jgi:hypothetical protein
MKMLYEEDHYARRNEGDDSLEYLFFGRILEHITER